MNLRAVYTTATFLSFTLAVQMLAPLAVAQEAGTKSEMQQPASTTPVDSSVKQEIEIDAPSAIARSQAEPAAPTAPATFEQAQQSVRVKTDETADNQDAVVSTPQQPEGAAAARVQPTTGTAASKPAGAAIAPAKQRRVRTFLIRFGALAAAGVALGTVFALSSASPSKPPGAH